MKENFGGNIFRMENLTFGYFMAHLGTMLLFDSIHVMRVSFAVSVHKSV